MEISAVVTVTSTPLRNGRKRVLRTSPKMYTSTASAVTSSPVRKQQCIELGNIDNIQYNKILNAKHNKI